MAKMAFGLVLASVLLPVWARGQDVAPRAFTPAPVGINLLSFGYSYSTGALLFDKTIPVENVEADIHGLNLGYSRTFGLFGLSGRADILVPFVAGEWIGDVSIGGVEQEAQAESRTGIADPMGRIVLNLIGAPVTCRTLSAAPPLVSESNLVSITPSIARRSLNALALLTASCPVMASMTR